MPKLDDVRDLVLAARELNPELAYLLCSWSAPASMKDPPEINGRTADGTPTAIIDTDENHAAFARWAAAAINYLDDEGCGLPVAFSPMNEPGHPVDYAGVGKITGDQVVRMANTFREVFDDSGLSEVAIGVGEFNHYGVTKMYLGSPDGWLWRFRPDTEGDGEPRVHDGAIMATHSYDGWANPTQLAELFGHWDAAMESTKDRRRWMTEWNPDGGDERVDGVPRPPLDAAIVSVQHLLRDMMQYEFDLWVWWNVWYPWTDWSGDRVLYDEVAQGTDEEPKKSKIYHALSMIWTAAPARFARAGRGEQHARLCRHLPAAGQRRARRGGRRLHDRVRPDGCWSSSTTRKRLTSSSSTGSPAPPRPCVRSPPITTAKTWRRWKWTPDRPATRSPRGRSA